MTDLTPPEQARQAPGSCNRTDLTLATGTCMFRPCITGQHHITAQCPGLNRHIVIGCSLLLLGCLSGQCADRAFSAEPAAPAASPNTLSGHELLRIGTIHDQQEHFPESLTYYNLALSKFREKKTAPRHRHHAGEDRADR
jgi:hypothetical protein